ncbi:MAG: YdeI/OmpD-associated family protein [Nitrosomonadales bacterium]|nr:YdeI/OmpD-associated family protein [Nitrosomonadales bacterium]
MEKPNRLKRELHPMPDFVRAALTAKKLTAAYDARPPYQRNDYIGWITRAKLPATQQKRLDQMLEELARGDVYMKMAYRAKRRY